MKKLTTIVLGILIVIVACNSDFKKAKQFKEQGDWIPAQEHMIKAVQANPKNARYRNELGFIYEKRGFYEMAEKEYNTAIRLDQYFVDAHYNLGSVLYRMYRFPEAIQQFEKVVEMDPNNAKALNNLALTVLAHEKNQQRALELYNKAIKLDPKNPAFYLNRGKLYQMMGQNENAKKGLERAANLKARSR